jgi:hypothetical protein
MEYKKGSFLQVGAGTFAGRFQAIRIIADATITEIIDSSNRENNIKKYISDSKSAIRGAAVIAARDGAFLRSVTITGGTIEIIF